MIAFQLVENLYVDLITFFFGTFRNVVFQLFQIFVRLCHITADISVTDHNGRYLIGFFVGRKDIVIAVAEGYNRLLYCFVVSF